MEYRTQDDLTFSTVGVGTYALTGVYGKKDLDAYMAMLRRAHELGVTFFDTADGYGDAERILGRAVAPFRDDIVLATKVSPKAGLKPDLTWEGVEAACDASLARLGTDRIDLYQVHYYDPDTPVGETVAALDALKEDGKIGAYGLGHLPRDQVRAYEAHGTVATMQVELSAVSRRSRTTHLPLCRTFDAGAIAFSATGRGLLTGRFQDSLVLEAGDIRHLDPHFQRDLLASGRRVAARVAEVARRYGRTPVQAAIAWALAQPQVVCALTGPSTVRHLEENAAAADWAWPYTELDEFDRFLEAEDARAAASQRETVRTLLTDPLDADPTAAFRDMVYVLETVIELGLAEAREVTPLFHELMPLRGQAHVHVREALEALRGKVLALLPEGA